MKPRKRTREFVQQYQDLSKRIVEAKGSKVHVQQGATSFVNERISCFRRRNPGSCQGLSIRLHSCFVVNTVDVVLVGL